MSEQLAQAEPERRAIVDAKEKGRAHLFATYLRLSGPGWLQSALTLGGGTLASSLYLGVLAGFSLLWLQPLAIALGAIMLCAVSYVTLSIKERPFQAINRHLNPLLGWMWLIGALMANIIWALPQYALSCGVLQKNLLPGVLGAESPLGEMSGKIAITVSVLVLSLAATWMYDTGGRGIKIYEWVLRILVVGIVLSFFGVVVVVVVQGGLDWSEALSGLIPDFTQLWKPAASLEWLLNAVPEEHRAFWSQTIVAEQRYALFAAASAAVGINSMFLLSYTMLRRGWDREFRGLSTFDLWCGMFLPFCLVTSCVVIASAVQFHSVEAEDRPLIAENSTQPLPVAGEKRLTELRWKLLRHQAEPAEFDRLSDEQISRQLPELSRAEQLLAWHFFFSIVQGVLLR
jgi:Mn2+/Fe2+ NRAMP family transporter